MSIENYNPFCDEWKKEISKMTKAEIIDMAQRIGLEKQKANDKLQVAEKALNDILKWQEDVDGEWDYPETIASNAFEKLAKLDGF